MHCGVASTEGQRRKVFDFRSEEYRGYGKTYLLNFAHDLHPAEDVFDSSSYIFYMEHKHSIIATARFVSPIKGEWELSPVLRQYNLAQMLDRDFSLEASRLVVARNMRKKMVAERIIWFATDWLVRKCSAKNYFAVCVPGVVSLFEKFGASLTTNDVIWVPSWSTQGYRFMSGNIRHTRDTLQRILRRGRCRLNPSGVSEYGEVTRGIGTQQWENVGSDQREREAIS